MTQNHIVAQISKFFDEFLPQSSLFLITRPCRGVSNSRQWCRRPGQHGKNRDHHQFPVRTCLKHVYPFLLLRPWHYCPGKKADAPGSVIIYYRTDAAILHGKRKAAGFFFGSRGVESHIFCQKMKPAPASPSVWEIKKPNVPKHCLEGSAKNLQQSCRRTSGKM